MLCVGVVGATRPSLTTAPDTVALLDDNPIDWSEIRDTLAETAGAQILEETILDRLLKERLAALGMKVATQDIDNERDMLIQSLSSDPDRAQIMLDSLRTQRLLGDRRFAALLRRNAMLRMLVRGEVVITETMLQSAYRATHGEKYQARIILAKTEQEIDAILSALAQGQDFVTLAVEHSTDSSAARGGLLEPISPDDERYPFALRQALPGLQAGVPSAAFALDGNYATALLVRVVPADGISFDQARSEVERFTRIGLERVRMDALAVELLQRAKIHIMEPNIAAGWNRMRGR